MFSQIPRDEQRPEDAARVLSAYRAILDDHMIVARTDRSGRITDVNEPFCRISQYSRQELVGSDHRILSSGLHPKSFWVEMWRTIAAGGVWRGDVCNRAKDGSLYWLDATVGPIRDQEGRITGYVAVRLDITARKRTEAMLVDACEASDLASRSKSEFLANMSHEIRTPMTAILGFTELLGTDDPSEQALHQRLEYIKIVRRNGAHLLGIINDILDLSKIEAGRMCVEQVETDVLRLVHDVLSLMRVKAEAKGLHLGVDCATRFPRCVRCDPLRLRQILVNLVGNAVKFTEIGHVTLSVSWDERSEALSVSVSDTGIGLTQEQGRHLFGAFVQADTSTTRRFGGTGLGLNLSRRFAQMLGGDITFRSVFAQGSTFTATVRAPAFPGAEMVSSIGPCRILLEGVSGPSQSERPPRPLTGVRILLAEDGLDNQRLISHHLIRAGADVRIVANGRLAVETLTVGGGIDSCLLAPAPVDVLLTDMQMPEMDGYEAARLLRSKGSMLPIIALTAHSMAGDAERCLAAGCDSYLPKPIDKAALVEVCRLAFENSATSRDRSARIFQTPTLDG